MDYAAHAQQLHDALADRLPLTFRDGMVLVTVRKTDVQGNVFSVLDAEASYLGTPVSLDLPLHYVNAIAGEQPLRDVQKHIAETVRRVVL